MFYTQCWLPFAEILSDMERKGVAIDIGHLREQVPCSPAVPLRPGMSCGSRRPLPLSPPPSLLLPLPVSLLYTFSPLSRCKHREHVFPAPPCERATRWP